MTFENEITEGFDIDVSFVRERVQNPTPNADRTIPKQDDDYLIFGFGIDV